jgi:hypothetical protein
MARPPVDRALAGNPDSAEKACPLVFGQDLVPEETAPAAERETEEPRAGQESRADRETEAEMDREAPPAGSDPPVVGRAGRATAAVVGADWDQDREVEAFGRRA